MLFQIADFKVQFDLYNENHYYEKNIHLKDFHFQNCDLTRIPAKQLI